MPATITTATITTSQYINGLTVVFDSVDVTLPADTDEAAAAAALAVAEAEGIRNGRTVDVTIHRHDDEPGRRIIYTMTIADGCMRYTLRDVINGGAMSGSNIWMSNGTDADDAAAIDAFQAEADRLRARAPRGTTHALTRTYTDRAGNVRTVTDAVRIVGTADPVA